MGLDMYVFSVDANDVAKSKTRKHTLHLKKDCHKSEVAYWRKHHDLHGLMEELYRSKGGKEDFNCIAMPLDEFDLDEIERRVEEASMPETTGFFFGNNPPDDESKAKDLKIVQQLRDELKSGRVVFYYSWW